MASGLMSIRYSDDGITTKARNAADKLSSISDTLSGVWNRLDDLPERSSRNNLSRASAFLRAKARQYDEREGALQVLQDRSNAFMSHVESAEKRLSDQIKMEYQAFNKQTGIGKTAVVAALEKLADIGEKIWKFFSETLPSAVKKAVDTVCEKVTELGKNIYDWYQAHKEDIEIVLKMVYQTVSTAVTVVLAVAAVASAIAAPSPVTILAAISSVTSAVDSITGFVKQTQVTTKYFQGDKAAARELDSKSNAEYMCGSDNTAGIVIYEGIQFAGNICGMISGGLTIKDGLGKGKNLIESLPFSKGIDDAQNSLHTYKDAVSLKDKAGKIADITSGILSPINKTFGVIDTGNSLSSDSALDRTKGVLGVGSLIIT